MSDDLITALSIARQFVPNGTEAAERVDTAMRAALEAQIAAVAPAVDAQPVACLICNSTGNATPCAYPTEINRQQAARIERLRKGLFEARDAMRVMSNWVKKSDPAGHSWAVRMVDRANDVLSHAPTTVASAQSEGLRKDAERSLWIENDLLRELLEQKCPDCGSPVRALSQHKGEKGD